MKTKTIFVTGGSRGIGEAVVRAAAGKYNVVFTYNNNEDKALSIQKEFEGMGVYAVKCDVTKIESVKNAVIFAKQKFSNIDILVNNAGISKSGLFIDISDEDWDEIINCNLNGVKNVTKEIIEDMLSKKSGCVINVASIWGEVGASCEVAYSTSKAAVIGFTKALSKEVAFSGVRVNAVSPGAVDTDMMKVYTKEEIKELCDEIPLGRLASAKEIAEAILFLAEADYITGVVLPINGGWN